MATVDLIYYKFNENNLLGKGSSGRVYLGNDKRTNNKVAIKAIDMKLINNQVLVYLLQSQKRALSTLKSPYVIRMYDIIQNNKYCYIVTEYCQGGTLSDYIKMQKRLNQRQALEIIRKIAYGMEEISSKNINHRDLKTANIMLHKGQPIIIDFGYCEHNGIKKPQMQYNVGSPSYMSPESYLHSQYTEKSDIWSLGVIYHEMITGELIDDRTPIKQLFSTMVKNGVKFRYNFSPQSTAILQYTLRTNPKERCNSKQLINLIENMIFNIKMRRRSKTNLSIKQFITYQNTDKNINNSINLNNNGQENKQKLNNIHKVMEVNLINQADRHETVNRFEERSFLLNKKYEIKQHQIRRSVSNRQIGNYNPQKLFQKVSPQRKHKENINEDNKKTGQSPRNKLDTLPYFFSKKKIEIKQSQQQQGFVKKVLGITDRQRQFLSRKFEEDKKIQYSKSNQKGTIKHRAFRNSNFDSSQKIQSLQLKYSNSIKMTQNRPQFSQKFQKVRIRPNINLENIKRNFVIHYSLID